MSFELPRSPPTASDVKSRRQNPVSRYTRSVGSGIHPFVKRRRAIKVVGIVDPIDYIRHFVLQSPNEPEREIQYKLINTVFTSELFQFFEDSSGMSNFGSCVCSRGHPFDYFMLAAIEIAYKEKNPRYDIVDGAYLLPSGKTSNLPPPIRPYDGITGLRLTMSEGNCGEVTPKSIPKRKIEALSTLLAIICIERGIAIRRKRRKSRRITRCIQNLGRNR